MRLRSLLALTGPVLLVLPGCTSDLPAPTNFVPVVPPGPPNELVVECGTLPITANAARYDRAPQSDPAATGGYQITGLLDGVTYAYSVDGELPAGLSLDPATGAFSGTVTADPGTYTFAILIEDVDDPEGYNARGECSLEVREKLVASIRTGTVPYCLQAGDDLRDLVTPGTGDGTEIVCDAPGGNGNGRVPDGIAVVGADDPTTGERGCTLTGSIQEDGRGTWVFMMRGIQSGREVYVPYCVTNDVAQGYEVVGSHSGLTDAELTPIARTYDPTMSFEIGGGGDPRYEVLSPGTCGPQCHFKFSFLRSGAPVARIGAIADDPCNADEDGFCLRPTGLVGAAPADGFFHEFYVSGPPVPDEFLDRPWALTTEVTYCMSGDSNGCDDISLNNGGSFTFGLIMVPQ